MVESQSKRVLVIETVLNNFKSHQTVLIMVTVLIIVSCIIWPMYSTYNSDILKKWETVLIIVTVLIIERSEYICNFRLPVYSNSFLFLSVNDAEMVDEKFLFTFG